ncbi:MAG: hypothetical protein ACOCUS_03195 [Polyangiales bacterium]
MRKQLGFVGLCCLAALVAVGCGDSGSDPDPEDAGRDRIIELDAGEDSGGEDADTGDDGGGTDGGTDECVVGDDCTPSRGCESGECLDESLFGTTLGGPMDPIQDHPDGDEVVDNVLFPDGYCMPRVPASGATETCDTEDPEACGDCASCLDLGGDPPLTMCLDDCVPNATDNSDCRDGYSCLLGAGVCFGGCMNDDVCNISRQDTDGDGDISQTDDENGDGLPDDELVYDTEMDATCNLDTYRCEHPGTEGAEAGDECEFDRECEEDGRCLSEASTEGDFPGGYCAKDGCDIDGIDCAGDGVCQSRRVGSAMCLEGCEVASGDWTEGDHASYTDVTGGCREGYACNWNGDDSAGTPNNGACLPGNFNDVTEPNVGEACTEDSECYSPFGTGLCLTGDVWGDGYCSTIDCGAPGVPTDVCGTDAQCLPVGEDDLTWCLKNCESADDCGGGLGCADYDGDPDTPKVCFPGCTSDEDCRSDETCEIPAGEMAGTCEAA